MTMHRYHVQQALNGELLPKPSDSQQLFAPTFENSHFLFASSLEWAGSVNEWTALKQTEITPLDPSLGEDDGLYSRYNLQQRF